MNVPTHVAIIPDGNRRWAKEQGLSALEGHQKGAEVFRDVALHAADRGVTHLSMWGMSLDNFSKRSPIEVKGLLSIFEQEFNELADSSDIHEREARINVIGRWQEKFPKRVRSAAERAIEATKGYSKHHLNFFLAYNGTDEMVSAVQAIIDSGKTSVLPNDIKEHLLTRDLPPVDLLLRTGGEPHLSAGFMMWDVADAQLYFTDTLWPAFGVAGLNQALDDYAARGRRFGK